MQSRVTQRTHSNHRIKQPSNSSVPPARSRSPTPSARLLDHHPVHGVCRDARVWIRLNMGGWELGHKQMQAVGFKGLTHACGHPVQQREETQF